ncbi:MAG: hypothetical protein ACD_72C00346G0002 [uncultured bacterium]|nr:MAG: hypothetical protein ACD_72C00346G0002 [uncultured bacterium]
MCFSATASFTASAVLGIVGVAAVSQTHNRRQLPLAFIPFIFAIQQLLEGWIWVSINNGGTHTALLTYLYLFFALFWWPFYIPIAIYLLEKDKKTKNAMFILWLIGLFVGILEYYSYTKSPLTAQIINHCIFYKVPSPLHIFTPILYLASTIGVTLLSSHKIIRLFGTLTAIFAAISAYLYYNNFTSIWCFFGAILSFVLFFHFKTKKV